MRAKLVLILLIVFGVYPFSAQGFEGTLQQIKKSGKIKIGYRASQPPMSFIDKDGHPAGYSIDICRDIVAEVKKTLGTDIKEEYVAVTAEERFNALRNKKIDILCGSTTKTLPRSEIVDFTQLTFVTGASLMTLKDNNAFKSGLDGTKIGVVKGTTTETELTKLIAETSTNAEIVLYDSTQEGIAALDQKQIDAFSSDQVVLIGIASKEEGQMNYVIKSTVFSFEPFALAVRRNDADFRLVADRVISEISRSKKIIDIYDKWIGMFTQQRLPIFDAMVQLNTIPE